MFTNLSLKGFTWRREPVLYIALTVAVLNVVASVLNGDVGAADAIESIVVLVGGFFARGKVTPA